MKIKCLKSDLLNGVNIVYKAVPSKTTMSILECILINANENVIKLTANDTELGIETIIDGAIEEKGCICLDAKILQEIVRKLPDSEVTIETDSKLIATIKCEKARFNIVGKSGDEFSYLPKLEINKPLILSQFALKDIVRQTIFSIAPETESNKIMTGELFSINNNKLKVVSLDGHRISIRNIELKNEYEDKKVIVPGKTLNEVSKIISGDMNKDIYIYFTDNHILFEFDETIVVSRLLEGEYFKIDQMLSNDYETKFSINKKEFLDCIDRATLLVKEGDKKPISIKIENNNMALRINSTMGSLNEDIDIDKVGKDISIGFNPRFLIDALKVIDDERVNVYMVNSKAPCFIKDDNDSYIYLVLPVNINNVG